MMKLLYPDGKITDEEAYDLVDFAAESRKRVKDQLYKIDETFKAEPAVFKYTKTKTGEEINAKFGFLVDAYKYGAPPHGGAGIGLDRLAMLMCGCDSLRDVTAFPKVQNASELMSEAPSTVSEEQLKELGIAITNSEE